MCVCVCGTCVSGGGVCVWGPGEGGVCGKCVSGGGVCAGLHCKVGGSQYMYF